MADSIHGPFAVTKFCGATVKGIQSSAGWQEQVSQLRVDLVEDLKNGDNFTKPDPGTPVSFVFGGFRFDGIVQSWGQNKSVGGQNYSINVYSPVAILDMVQVILDGFHGINTAIPNLLNVFGYLEGIDPVSGGYGFGGAGKNESGIRWYKIKEGIEAVQTGKTPFGPPIIFKGHTYVVDLSSIPTTIPDFYRVGGGPWMTLSEIIHRVFQDAGYDFLVQLKMGVGTGPHTIYFKTHSLLIQPPLGQIEQIVYNSENVSSLEEGAELRDDVTCGVILGGNIEESTPMYDPGDGSVIWPFWGFQNSNYLVPFGQYGNPPFNPSSGYGNNHTMILNSTGIVDIIGTTTYECSILEMRCALDSFDSWANYIARQRPDIVTPLGIQVVPSLFGTDAFQEFAQSLYSADQEVVGMFAAASLETEGTALEKTQQLHAFIQSQAQTYFGKQFIVRMPFYLKYYFEEETNQLWYDSSVNADGYWPDYIGGQSGPLNLSYENFNFFMNGDTGKFIPFVKYAGPNLAFADFSRRSQDDIVFQPDGVYVRCSIDPNILFAPAPCVLITIDEPLWMLPPDPLGGIEEIAQIFNTDVNTIMTILDRNGGEFPMRLAPMPISPNAVNLTFRNNVSTYGPWYKAGAPGRVRIEQDTTLVPWNYGGFDTMNTAAQAQLADINKIVNQTEESGSIVQAGAPTISLGDVLNDASSPVTAIDVTVDPQQGILTTIRLRSQTAVTGTFSRQNAERLRRVGTAAQNMRKTLRSLYDIARQNAMISNRAQFTLVNNVSRAVRQQEIMTVFQSYVFKDEDGNGVSMQGFMNKFEGALGASKANDDAGFQNMATMGMEGLLRPFTTNTAPDSGVNLPHMEVPQTGSPNQIQVTVNDLNPFTSDSDMLWAAHGDTYSGFFTRKDGVAWDNLRTFSLRGPMWLTAWGRDVGGQPVPNSNENDQVANLTTDYLDNYKKQFNKWKSGPIDLKWDRWRKVWTGGGGLLFGTYQGSNQVKLDAVNDTITTASYFNITNLPVNTKVAMGFDMLANTWKIIAADCPSSG